MRRSSSLFSLPSFMRFSRKATRKRAGTRIASAIIGFNRIAQTNGGMEVSLP